FEREPDRAMATMSIHPDYGTDIIASGILDFGEGSATFTCSTQMSAYQRVNILGTEGQIEIEIPVNAPANETTTMWLASGDERIEETIAACDQYTLQGDAMSQAILNNSDLPVTLDDAVANMRVIESMMASHRQAGWVSIESNI
ncbi:MAG: Gfo/Idh/MocA family oxidoreductase, partial [Pseudomonadota bacterium]